jgi:hypothetical protein
LANFPTIPTKEYLNALAIAAMPVISQPSLKGQCHQFLTKNGFYSTSDVRI